MKYNKLVTLLAVAITMLFSSCRPYNVPDIQQIAPNETAFLVPLEGERDKQVKFDSEEFLEKNKIAHPDVSKELLVEVARASLMTKVHPSIANPLTDIIVEAVNTIRRED